MDNGGGNIIRPTQAQINKENPQKPQETPETRKVISEMSFSLAEGFTNVKFHEEKNKIVGGNIGDYTIIKAHNKGVFEWKYFSDAQLKEGIVFTVQDKEGNERMIFYKDGEVIDSYNGEVIKKIRWNHIITIDPLGKEKTWIVQSDGTMISGIDHWWSAEKTSPHGFHQIHTVEIGQCTSLEDSKLVKTYPVYHKESIRGIENLSIYIPEICEEKLDGLFDTNERTSDLINRVILSEVSYPFRNTVKECVYTKTSPDNNALCIAYVDGYKERTLLKEKGELIEPES